MLLRKIAVQCDPWCTVVEAGWSQQKCWILMHPLSAEITTCYFLLVSRMSEDHSKRSLRLRYACVWIPHPAWAGQSTCFMVQQSSHNANQHQTDQDKHRRWLHQFMHHTKNFQRTEKQCALKTKAWLCCIKTAWAVSADSRPFSTHGSTARDILSWGCIAKQILPSHCAQMHYLKRERRHHLQSIAKWLGLFKHTFV